MSKNLKQIFYLFLDVDGVLNNSKSTGWNPDFTNVVLDTENLNNYFSLLSFLQKRYEVKVVLSSGWVLHPEDLEFLKEKGVIWNRVSVRKLTSTREQEIRMTLREELKLRDGYDIHILQNFLVLDDQLQKKEWGDKLVHCTFQEGGFTKELLQQTKKIITAKFPK